MLSGTKPEGANPDNASPDTPYVREFPCPEPAHAVVRIGSGVVTVTAEDRPFVVVSISPYDGSEASQAAAADTRVTFPGNRLLVETADKAGRFLRRNGQVRVEIRLPLDSQLEAKAGSADVRTEGRLTEVVVHTGSGDVYVEHTSGDVGVDSGSGDVRAVTVGGSLRVHTGSGDVSATAVTGPVDVRVASGDVEIEAPSGPVTVSSASGDIHIAAVRRGQTKINSASGDVSIGVPEGTRVWLDLGTMSGATTCDLDMTGTAPEQGAELSLQVRTMSGDINVHRASP